MNVALWSSQILLAVVFLVSGTAKSTMSPERMAATGQTGVALFPLPVVRLTAAAELAGAIGLILPGLTGTAPALTGLAAAGLGVVMVGAGAAHLQLHEPKNVAIATVLFALCAFVAVGRVIGA